jgi:DNA-binding transcriptional regulator YdaS (Cro superfamily)
MSIAVFNNKSLSKYIYESLLTSILRIVNLSPMELKTYLEERGGGLQLASAVGVSPVIISQWKTGARQVPAERCPAIEKATSGAVRCEELRPDVDWAYLRATNCPADPLAA